MKISFSAWLLIFVATIFAAFISIPVFFGPSCKKETKGSWVLDGHSMIIDTCPSLKKIR
ncbi:hypothetical protein KJ671_03385 [Patescibacteria group bacterium]|nr:hypothetical protein [Patescibacteria group bacterium]